MTASKPASCCCVVAMLLLACSCRSTQTAARDAYQQDLATRDHAARNSTTFYQQGADADAQGKPDAARDLFQRAVAADEDNAVAWMALGGVEFRLENYFEAAEAFHHAARLAPTRYEPHFNLGTVLEAVGRYSDATKAYDVALSLAPDEPAVIENLARTLIRSGQDPERAEALVRQALRTEFRPDWREWLLLQASRLGQTTRPAALPATTRSTDAPASRPALSPPE
jgi:cytochrome c-type biogenesis protein CcmH/NrfG